MTSRRSTQKQYALRKELLQDHMSAIARVAKADLPRTPQVDMFRVPHERVRPSAATAALSVAGPQWLWPLGW